jgi:hypothetical protein
MAGLALIVAALILVPMWLAPYKPGGARNEEEIRAIAARLRRDCSPNGFGIEKVHGERLEKAEIFKCPDGTIGFVPFGYDGE